MRNWRAVLVGHPFRDDGTCWTVHRVYYDRTYRRHMVAYAPSHLWTPVEFETSTAVEVLGWVEATRKANEEDDPEAYDTDAEDEHRRLRREAVEATRKAKRVRRLERELE